MGGHFDVRGFDLKMTVVVFVRVYKTTVIFNAFIYFRGWAGEHFDVRGFDLKMTVAVFMRVYKTTTVIFNAFSYF